MNLHVRLAALGMLFCLALPALSARAGEPGAPAVVTVAVIGDYPPYDIYENGQASGIANDMMKALFERLDVPVRVWQLPFKRALWHLQEGHIDALAGVGRNPERERYAVFPDGPLAVTRVAFFVRAGSPITYPGDLQAMSRYTIGTTRGFMYTQEFQALVERGALRVEESPTVESNIQKLLLKRYDLIIANAAVARSVARQLNAVERLQELRPPVDTGYMYLGISRKSPLAAWVERIDQTLAALRDEGVEERIHARYIE